MSDKVFGLKGGPSPVSCDDTLEGRLVPGLKFPARVLLVDDNPELVENLTEILEQTGHRVSSAKTVGGALKLAGTFDVALVDLRLPDGEGTQLAAQLKKQSPESEVVLLTGFATVETAAAAVRAGAFAYLVKPCATDELLLTVEQALRQVRLHREKKDLTRRAQMAEKLASVGTLTAGLSHEIRNPLNAATLQLSVLERRVRQLAAASQKPLLEPLALVRDEIKRLDHILEDFLQFARPRELSTTPLDVKGLVDKVMDLLGGQAEQRGVSLSREVPDGLQVVGDEGRLRQVLMNLLLNALEATPNGGRVRVGVESQEDQVVIQVDDSGPGVAAEVRERIFEPFFTTKASGSGLGLSIVHAIVVQHGGRISVGDAPGGGARFELSLPAPA